MLIFGAPTPREQIGRPFPAIRFALAIPADGTKKPVLHAFGCSKVPPHSQAAQSGFSEIVYSTTRNEIEEHAGREFDEAWDYCDDCGG